MTNRAMLFGALYKLKVMHGQQTYTVCGCSYLCVHVCGCYYTRIYIYIYIVCIYVSVSLDCMWDMNASKATGLSSLTSGFSLWGVTFARLAATLDLYSFWETSGPVSQSLIKSTLQPQSATTCHSMLCLSWATLSPALAMLIV